MDLDYIILSLFALIAGLIMVATSIDAGTTVASKLITTAGYLIICIGGYLVLKGLFNIELKTGQRR